MWTFCHLPSNISRYCRCALPIWLLHLLYWINIYSFHEIYTSPCSTKLQQYNINSTTLCSHFLVFCNNLKPVNKRRKEALNSTFLSQSPVEYTSFPIQSNKIIDLPALWHSSPSNSALALNTNKKFSIRSPRRQFNHISAFPKAKSAIENLI